MTKIEWLRDGYLCYERTDSRQIGKNTSRRQVHYVFGQEFIKSNIKFALDLKDFFQKQDKPVKLERHVLQNLPEVEPVSF